MAATPEGISSPERNPRSFGSIKQFGGTPRRDWLRILIADL
jgi:hypothetical protein